MSNEFVVLLSGSLNKMYEKKKFRDEEFTSRELSLVKRFKNSSLLRALVDPSVPFEVDTDYVPSQMELELAFFIVSGRMMGSDISTKDAIRVVYSAVECSKDLHKLLYSVS